MQTLVHILAAVSGIDVSSLPHATTDSSKVQAILNIVFSILGGIAALMLVIGGFRYITAQGDPSQLSKAKETIIYSLVGVVVAIFAVTIVSFVLGKVA
jgi:TRAP-type C4-dicarboxylate transport system permease small subunit